MLHALYCHKTVAMKTPMSVSDSVQSLHWELGQFYMCPTALCLATVFNWLRHRNEAPKSALHFGPGRYRLYWNRFHIGTGSRYPTLCMSALTLILQHLSSSCSYCLVELN